MSCVYVWLTKPLGCYYASPLLPPVPYSIDVLVATVLTLLSTTLCHSLLRSLLTSSFAICCLLCLHIVSFVPPHFTLFFSYPSHVLLLLYL
ncbi:hypothetical protein PISMIDRAFT_685040 [Pisolithus microcarpus 441]|uniref:Uncharacterized protein n=1 Tax=Pisolithus microcarpus 441 TaxID=765257 RepID=A0A0C9XYU4_9AGAM|nr:hypothetical protein PISMIDRAFT_685040 [Pisolithus microcarpus 441]